MKTTLGSMALAMAAMFGTASLASAQHHHHGSANYGGYNSWLGQTWSGNAGYYGGYSAPGTSYGGSGYGGYGYSSYGYQPTYGYQSRADWHNTSHFDYHPASLQPHGNHVDYVPGHSDYHRQGHWDAH